MQDPVSVRSVQNLIRVKFVQNENCVNFGSDAYHAKIGMSPKEDIKMDLRRAHMVKTLLKIRGQIFVG